MNLQPQQQSAKTKLLNYKVGALFMKMGTGKTRVAVELVNAVTEPIDLVVYVAPLRIIKPVDESIQPITAEVEKWGGFNAKETVFIGVETIQASDRQYLQLFRKISEAWRVFIIVDESIKIKNINAKRTKRLLELGAMADYKLILNGEPITKDLLDIYPQIQFLSPKILNMDFAEFKDTFCEYTRITKTNPGRYKEYTKEFITGYANIDFLYSLIGEYVYECDVNFNIERIFEEKRYRLDAESRELYKHLKEKYLDNEMLQFMNNNIFLEMTQKMQHEYSCTEEKFEAVKEWFETVPEEKTIIFCKYIRSREECRKRFPKATVLSYQQDSYGHNLPYLPNMVMFDKIWDLNLLNQAMARNFRITTTENVRVLKLTGDVGLENLIDKNIQKKVGMNEYFKKISREQLKKVL
ncbi:MAG: SNF2-related protein [Edaphocola sp.]